MTWSAPGARACRHPHNDAVLLQSFDEEANVLGVKGVGELGNCGARPAGTRCVKT
jgi:hypothetical protein